MTAARAKADVNLNAMERLAEIRAQLDAIPKLTAPERKELKAADTLAALRKENAKLKAELKKFNDDTEKIIEKRVADKKAVMQEAIDRATKAYADTFRLQTLSVDEYRKIKSCLASNYQPESERGKFDEAMIIFTSKIPRPKKA